MMRVMWGMHARLASAIAFVLGIGCGACGGSPGGDDGGGDDGPPPPPQQFDVRLMPASGVAGTQRVNFAVPLATGVLSDETAIRITAGGTDVPAARRGLARHPDGSLRSVQIQIDIDVDANPMIGVEVGAAGAGGVTMVPVADTLVDGDDAIGPMVWALLPAAVLSGSGVAGPVGTDPGAWSSICDYARWDTEAFLAGSSNREAWLFDRVTANYRGYAITGEQVPLVSAYREAGMYRAGMTIANGLATGIAPPDADDDLKYHYSQGVAIHYLLTGDDRYREAAEAIAAKVETMWDPMYDGGAGFWTERHAGFALLAYEWAAIVSDDRATEIGDLAAASVDAYIAGQMSYPTGYTDTEARCFAHSADAHGEPYGYDGCSPWMSAILADGLDAHARRVGGTRADDARAALARLGRIVARDGLDPDGRPYYWMGVGNDGHEIDPYDEHWGESAYVVALAWRASGSSDATLRQAADALVTGLEANGEVGQVRSFNWQCRSAVMTPALLAP
jgi:hypothetical protein